MRESKYVTVVIRMPDSENDKQKVRAGLKLIEPFQSAMSLEDEMTILELIEQHDDFKSHIAEDARAKAAELHAAHVAAETQEGETTIPVVLNLHPSILAELDYLVKLHKEYGAPNQYPSVEELLAYVANAVADGSRRPGAWERGLLEQMGLVPGTPLAEMYRSQYGDPELVMKRATDSEIAAIKTLDGKNFAMLDSHELAFLELYRKQGRKLGVSIEIVSDVAPAILAEAKTQQEADQILKRANSIVRVVVNAAA